MHSLTRAASGSFQLAWRIIGRQLGRSAASERSRGLEPDWGTAIDDVVAELEKLNRSTEQDFLAVGES
jgi:hypothetical protein